MPLIVFIQTSHQMKRGILFIEFIFLFSCTFSQTVNELLENGAKKSELKDFTVAIEDYTKAIEKDPENPKAFNLRANIKYRVGDLEGAISDYSSVIALEPNIFSHYLNRATARKEKGNLRGGY